MHPQQQIQMTLALWIDMSRVGRPFERPRMQLPDQRHQQTTCLHGAKRRQSGRMQHDAFAGLPGKLPLCRHDLYCPRDHIFCLSVEGINHGVRIHPWRAHHPKRRSRPPSLAAIGCLKQTKPRVQQDRLKTRNRRRQRYKASLRREEAPVPIPTLHHSQLTADVPGLVEKDCQLSQRAAMPYGQPPTTDKTTTAFFIQHRPLGQFQPPG